MDLVNVVPGAGVTGAALTAHPGVHGITFTGSVPTGRAIARSAADTFKKVVLEMGGKSPNIVFDDADLDAALKGSVWGIFNNAGQVCVAGTRLLVQASIAERFVERLQIAAERVRVGDPTADHDTHGTAVQPATVRPCHGIPRHRPRGRRPRPHRRGRPSRDLIVTACSCSRRS